VISIALGRNSLVKDMAEELLWGCSCDGVSPQFGEHEVLLV
jgi:hypothetical protein